MDIGCGPGRYALLLASKTEAQIFATDLSRAMVQQGREQANANLVCWALSDACRLPFADESFDAILLFLVLHQVADPKKALQEAYRLLRPGGHCLISTHSHRQLDRQTLFRFFPEARKVNKKRMPSLAKLKDLLRATCFHHLRTKSFTDGTNYSRESYLEKIRGKPSTSLRAMSEADFQRRYAALEAALAGQECCMEEVMSTILVARK